MSGFVGVGFVGTRWESRPVERGACLVASVPGDSKVIIQLPRGKYIGVQRMNVVCMYTTLTRRP